MKFNSVSSDFIQIQLLYQLFLYFTFKKSYIITCCITIEWIQVDIECQSGRAGYQKWKDRNSEIISSFHFAYFQWRIKPVCASKSIHQNMSFQFFKHAKAFFNIKSFLAQKTNCLTAHNTKNYNKVTSLNPGSVMLEVNILGWFIAIKLLKGYFNNLINWQAHWEFIKKRIILGRPHERFV